MVLSTANNTRIKVGSQDILQDVRKNGKAMDWKGHKISNTHYSVILDMLQFKKSKNVRQCAEVLEFVIDKNNTMKLDRAWFCKSKLCPLCNWRRSMKLGYQNMEIVENAVREEPKGRFLFLTLTVKNVYGGDELNKAMSAITAGFNRLFKYKKVDKNMIGWLRSTEVTINPVDNSYHPHVHVLLMVKSTYFKDSINYIKQDEWTELWQKAMKLDYAPVVNIKAVKGKTGKKSDTTKAVLETSKYPVKDSDYLTGDIDYDMEVIGDLEKGLFRKRQVAYGGLFKKLHAILHLQDDEDDLLNIGGDVDDLDEDVKSIIAIYNYQRKNYFIF